MPTELLPYAFSHGLLFAPGTNYAYSNTGYVLLGLVVEKVTAKPLGQVLRERIIDPLGLRATSFPTDAAVPDPFVHGYAHIGGGPLLDITLLLHPSFLYAAGQIISTAADLTTFFGALLKGRLLPAAFLAQMKTGSSVAATYGLGMQVSFSACGRVYGHEGDFVGWRNIVWSNAKGTRVAAVLVNIDTTYVSWPALGDATLTALCKG